VGPDFAELVPPKPEPPPPPPATGSFAGGWRTICEEGNIVVAMTLTQTGSNVTGIYTNPDGLQGKISGVVNGNTLTGTYQNTLMPRSETFEFVLSAGANAFTGYYAKGRQKFTWTGTRESRPPSTLVSRWSADGNAGDSVGGNAGTVKGGVSYAAGVSGQAFSIDGRRGSGVVLGNPVNLRLQSFTIVAWLKRADARKSTWDNELNPTACILCYGPGGYAFGMWDDGRLLLSKNAYSGVNTSQVKITDTEFHLVALTVTESRVVFYVDGQSETMPPYNPGYTFSYDVAIGASANGTDLRVSWFGLIDEVQFHNRALTAEEIQAIARK
jgi:hypothetical protein